MSVVGELTHVQVHVHVHVHYMYEMLVHNVARVSTHFTNFNGLCILICPIQSRTP